MPLLRRPAGAAETALAVRRVQALRPEQGGGWVPPPLPDDEDAPVEGTAVPDPQPEAAAAPAAAGRHAAGGSAVDRGSAAARVHDADGPPAPRPPAPRLLDRLRAGRLDPGRPAVVGLALVGLLACLVAALLLLRAEPQQVSLPQVEVPGRPIEGSTLPTPTGAAPTTAGDLAAEVVVAVAGKVRRPGLVRLPPGSRVDDALRAAGGLAPGASPGLLNLARKVVDGEQVLVGVAPLPGAVPPGSGPAPEGGGRLLDLNAATPSELDGLPGIGPVLAERIVEHRTRNGPFRSVDQLREVPGIGEAKFASLRAEVTV